ncbi:MAG: isochorismate synthase [Chloroflexota bacterium]|nr:isochorismate synthase [Chloroflexota bacterium]
MMNSGNGHHPTLVACSRAVEHESLLTFLRAHAGQPRLFWQRGQYATAYAGAGVAAQISAAGAERFSTIRDCIGDLFAGMHHDTDAPASVRPRLFGGFSFNDTLSDEPLWQPFGAAQFILPRLMITRMGGYSWLTVCDYGVGDVTERVARLREMWGSKYGVWAERILPQTAHPATGAGRPLPLQDDASRGEVIDLPTWRAMLRSGIDMIRDGALRKIVLARAVDAELDAPVDPLQALETLEKNYPTAWRFLFEPTPDAVFFGATPELLVRLEEGTLHTHALAGSTPRGASPGDDDRLAAALLASAKDRHEHALVVDWLRDSLTPISRTVEAAPTPTVVKLKNIQHLFTPVSAQLRERSSVLSIVQRLHPTPALGGSPQTAAQAAIAQIEPMERGWYGAPVGWVDAAGDGEFAVAIRSAVAADTHLRFYAGAGIVADSEPDKEWDETALKFKPMMEVTGIQYDLRPQP